MSLEQTWRWYGPNDPVSIWDVRMAGATGVVTALHHVPIGAVWEIDEIRKRKQEVESAGLVWSVVESVPLHEDIKKREGDFEHYIENYKQSLRNLAECGIDTVCYNFMPILDWTRTDLAFPMEDGSTALKYDIAEFAAFEIYLLERHGAEKAYTEEIRQKAKDLFASWDQTKKDQLVHNIIAGLPGTDAHFDVPKLRELLATYEGISALDLKNNLHEFLRDIVPTAEECGIYMTIHPDDPPFPIMGLPRVVSTEQDAVDLLAAYESDHNGLCFCTGSYGARPDNDLVGMIERLGHRFNFIHLRSTKRDEEGNFYEADHLDGDVDMYGVMKALMKEKKKRLEAGRVDARLPMRPDHGHHMLD
ncbi:MAG: mannonate dehydratase, partial [Ekhidna sp.]|nr:mannonate dehydratase [Ekhidna sp.]